MSLAGRKPKNRLVTAPWVGINVSPVFANRIYSIKPGYGSLPHETVANRKFADETPWTGSCRVSGGRDPCRGEPDTVDVPESIIKGRH